MIRIVSENPKKICKQIDAIKSRIALPIEQHHAKWYTECESGILLDMLPRYLGVVFSQLKLVGTVTYQLEVATKLHKDMWPSGDFSDVTLVAAGTQFAVHRAVLASASPYFHALFRYDAKKFRQIITLHETSAEELRYALSLVYRVPIPIGGLDTLRMVAAAHKFQIELPLENSLLDHIAPSDDVDVWTAVELLDRLYPVALDYTIVDRVLFECITLETLKDVFPSLPKRYQDVHNSIYEPM